MKVSISDAKTNLLKLIARAEAGEEVIITRAGRAAVRLVPAREPKRKIFKPGALKGRIIVPDNFLEPDTALEELSCN